MATYFVKNGGSDAADGLSDPNAWATLNKVNTSAFNAGDTVQFRCGDTWSETLTIPSSGASGNPITFTSYGSGNRPLFNASSVFTDWVLDTGSIYKRNMGPSQIFENNVRLIKATSKAAMVAGSWFKDATPTTFLWCGDSGNPNSGHNIEVSLDRGTGNHGGAAVYINDKNYLVINGIEGSKAENDGFRFGAVGSTTVTIQNCMGSYNGGRGVFSGAPGSSSTPHTFLTIKNCIGAANLGEGFWMGCGDHFIIDTCEAYELVDENAKGYTFAAGGYGGILICFIVSDCIVQNCYVHDIYRNTYILIEKQPSGIRSQGVVVRYNLLNLNVAATGGRGGIGCQGQGCSIINNVIIGSAANGNVGAGLDAGSNGGLNNTIAHNTVYGRFSFWATVIASDTGTGNKFKDNIVWQTSPSGADGLMGIGSNGIAGTILNGNCYWTTNAGSWYFWWTQDSTASTTLAAWQSRSGQDPNSMKADPLLANPLQAATGNFHLQATSPCRNTGVRVVGVDDAWAESAPDIGAFEYDVPAPGVKFDIYPTKVTG